MMNQLIEKLIQKMNGMEEATDNNLQLKGSVYKAGRSKMNARVGWCVCVLYVDVSEMLICRLIGNVRGRSGRVKERL